MYRLPACGINPFLGVYDVSSACRFICLDPETGLIITIGGKDKVRTTTRLLGTALSVFFCGFGMAAGPAVGQTAAPPPASQPIVAPTPLEQSMQGVPGPALQPTPQRYDGVVPGPTGKNPLPAAPKGGPHLVWTGFQMTATGSRVFLQTTAPIPFDLDEGRVAKSGKSTLAVRLAGCRIHMANNRRKIDTRFFATPVSGVTARQKGHDVEVRIALREVAAGVPHSEPGPDGSQFVVIDFPPGKAAPEPTALSDMARASGIPDGSREMEAEDADASSRRPGKKAPKAKR
jgi:hypothetical protein